MGRRIASSIGILFCLGLVLNAYPQNRSRRKAKNNGTSSKREPDLSERIDRSVEAQVRKLGIPGFSLAVISGKTTLIQKGYGFSNVKDESPVTPHTVFGIGAVTETFTAMALLVLVDDGKVKLDIPISRYITGLPASWRKLTLRQLASMNAGIPNEPATDVPWTDAMESLEKEPLAFTPGSNYLNSENSYRIIGTVIEQVTKQSYVEFLRSRIFGPLGMLDTAATDRNFDPPIATPYQKGPSGQFTPAAGYEKPESSFAAGMLASNTVDLAKYASALTGGKLLSPGGYELLWKKRPPLPSGSAPKWAFGWGSGSLGGHPLLTAIGNQAGVTARLMIFPDDKLIVIGLANTKLPEAQMLTQSVANMVLGIDTPAIEEEK